MKKSELISLAAERLRKDDVRKHVPTQKAVFHITDDDGNTSDFVIRKQDRGVLYTADDVAVILNTCLDLIEESIRRGEEVSIYGFGTFGLKYMAATTVVRPDNGEIVEIKAHYTPKFFNGKNLRLAAKVYDMLVSEGKAGSVGDIGLDEVAHDGD